MEIVWKSISFMEIKCCLYFVKEYNVETESTIRQILYSSRPIRFQIFCRLALKNDKYFSGGTCCLYYFRQFILSVAVNQVFAICFTFLKTKSVTIIFCSNHYTGLTVQYLGSLKSSLYTGLIIIYFH